MTQLLQIVNEKLRHTTHQPPACALAQSLFLRLLSKAWPWVNVPVPVNKAQISTDWRLINPNSSLEYLLGPSSSTKIECSGVGGKLSAEWHLHLIRSDILTAVGANCLYANGQQGRNVHLRPLAWMEEESVFFYSTWCHEWQKSMRVWPAVDVSALTPECPFTVSPASVYPCITGLRENLSCWVGELKKNSKLILECKIIKKMCIN